MQFLLLRLDQMVAALLLTINIMQSDELIRNLSITFATIAVVSILLIVNIQVSYSMVHKHIGLKHILADSLLNPEHGLHPCLPDPS